MALRKNPKNNRTRYGGYFCGIQDGNGSVGAEFAYTSLRGYHPLRQKERQFRYSTSDERNI